MPAAAVLCMRGKRHNCCQCEKQSQTFFHGCALQLFLRTREERRPNKIPRLRMDGPIHAVPYTRSRAHSILCCHQAGRP
jgi:hypothetical protein